MFWLAVPVVQVGTSRLGRRGLESLQTTFPLNHTSCQILSTLHFSLCMGLIRLLMFHTSLPGWLRFSLRSRHWTASCPRSRRLSRPWPSLRRLGTGLSAFGFGRPQSTAISPGSLGGDASAAEATLLRRGLLSPTFAFRAWLWVFLARDPGCPSRHEPARSQGFRIHADNFPNELARV